MDKTVLTCMINDCRPRGSKVSCANAAALWNETVSTDNVRYPKDKAAVYSFAKNLVTLEAILYVKVNVKQLLLISML